MRKTRKINKGLTLPKTDASPPATWRGWVGGEDGTRPRPCPVNHETHKSVISSCLLQVQLLSCSPKTQAYSSFSKRGNHPEHNYQNGVVFCASNRGIYILCGEAFPNQWDFYRVCSRCPHFLNPEWFPLQQPYYVS